MEAQLFHVADKWKDKHEEANSRYSCLGTRLKKLNEIQINLLTKILQLVCILWLVMADVPSSFETSTCSCSYEIPAFISHNLQ